LSCLWEGKPGRKGFGWMRSRKTGGDGIERREYGRFARQERRAYRN